MRRIIVLSMISLDGVIQAPGAPGEDPAGGFDYGGWVAPYLDEVYSKVLEKQLQPTDLLLGRKTFEIWEDYWPKHAEVWPGINEVNKYILSTTLSQSDWQNCLFLNNPEEIRKLKNSEGNDLQVHGSAELVQLLLKNDWVDELWLKIHPLTLGKGKKLFVEGVIPAAFTLLETAVTPSGVIMANYRRAGEVQTGTAGA